MIFLIMLRSNSEMKLRDLVPYVIIQLIMAMDKAQLGEKEQPEVQLMEKDQPEVQ